MFLVAGSVRPRCKLVLCHSILKKVSGEKLSGPLGTSMPGVLNDVYNMLSSLLLNEAIFWLSYRLAGASTCSACTPGTYSNTTGAFAQTQTRTRARTHNTIYWHTRTHTPLGSRDPAVAHYTRASTPQRGPS
jgi:hypothetical protein